MIKHQEQVFVDENLSNLTSPISGEASVSSTSNNNNNNNNNRGEPSNSIYPQQPQYFSQQQLQDQSELPSAKRKRNLPGNPDPESEVIALSPRTLLATNRFVCEVCNKGFQRDQNLQLHRRGHNLPWKLKQRSKTEVIKKKVYVCPEISCVHHDPSRALGDLTGIKKHFSRKHGEKKHKCDKCSKRYAVQSDWKAHSKVCGTREYRCDCGTLFSRRDSFITHRAFCDALAEESARAITLNPLITNQIPSSLPSNSHFMNNMQQQHQNMDNSHPLHAFPLKKEQQQHNLINLPPWLSCQPIDTNTPHHINHGHHHDLTSPSSSSSPIFLQDHHQYPNNNHMGPTFTISGAYNNNTQSTTSPFMSATALLQKAAQMGATMSKTSQQQQQQFQGHVTDNITNTNITPNSTAGMFGLNLSSRDNQQEFMSSSAISSGLIVNHGLSSFGNNNNNKAATPTTTCGPGPSPGMNPGLGPSSTAFLHDMITSYDDAFGIDSVGMMITNKKETRGGGGNGVVTRGNEGLTRDFLGLRQLSHDEMLTIAELGNSIATNTSTTTTTTHHNYQQENQKSW